MEMSIPCPFAIFFKYRAIQALSSHESNALVNSHWKGTERRRENNA